MKKPERVTEHKRVTDYRKAGRVKPERLVWYEHINLYEITYGFGWTRDGDPSTNTISNYLGQINEEVGKMKMKICNSVKCAHYNKNQDNHCGKRTFAEECPNYIELPDPQWTLPKIERIKELEIALQDALFNMVIFDDGTRETYERLKKILNKDNS